MFCPKCGNTLSAEAVFCPKCGQKIEVDKSSSEASSDRSKNLDSNGNKDNKVSKKKIIGAIIGIICIVAILLCVYVYRISKTVIGEYTVSMPMGYGFTHEYVYKDDGAASLFFEGPVLFQEYKIKGYIRIELNFDRKKGDVFDVDAKQDDIDGWELVNGTEIQNSEMKIGDFKGRWAKKDDGTDRCVCADIYNDTDRFFVVIVYDGNKHALTELEGLLNGIRIEKN